ncbi:MAG: Gfo/Idh/MocA family oxidoreductase [Verrucomicrobia bacterium]|nr:Gfo/Idh/MocA family oxidoreductase [Verrucomicrobiota bacterium]MBU4247899.1 Gfo/Idh/MocA family oxidoreductase [Verrucomicrobiota bacterium]MBU4291277.1 Gfo/Idh/MocA family oxidoreductase [Verrucomicrobiota bacterium]MBU4496761.1 Gfo/Idh/MocA family oxidoreductase [Verrucomicrobiota bacterium]MCG2679165.1 Gfo/Idh/MocA family oxidoreductase [Kiritimatiellia bacterium]
MRIGLISAATYGPSYLDGAATRTPGSFHGTAFAGVCNGCDEEKATKWQWTFVPNKKVLDAQVVKIWDPHREWAERLAEVCFIPKVADTPEDCADDVDAVVIVDDGSGKQWKYAMHPLKKGIPTFCDKPLAMTARLAQDVAKVVRATRTPFMSASSLRFVPDILALKKRVAAGEFGEISMVTAICGNELVYYGIHALAMYYGVFGGGAVSCVNVGRPGRNIVRVRFKNGCDLTLMVAESDHMRSGYQINIYGKKDWITLTPDLNNLYTYLLDQFLVMVRTGKEPVPVEEEVEVIAVLDAGRRSLQEAREVTVAEVMA